MFGQYPNYHDYYSCSLSMYHLTLAIAKVIQSNYIQIFSKIILVLTSQFLLITWLLYMANFTRVIISTNSNGYSLTFFYQSTQLLQHNLNFSHNLLFRLHFVGPLYQ